MDDIRLKLDRLIMVPSDGPNAIAQSPKPSPGNAFRAGLYIALFGGGIAAGLFLSWRAIDLANQRANTAIAKANAIEASRQAAGQQAQECFNNVLETLNGNTPKQ